MNFGAMGDMVKNFAKVQQLLKDDNFRTFLENPEVKKLMDDKDFQQAVKEKNYLKLMSNKKLLQLMQNPEIQESLSKLNLKDLNINK